MCLLCAPVWMWNRCITWQSITLAAVSLWAKEFCIFWCLRGVQHFASCLADCSTTHTVQPCSVSEDTEKSQECCFPTLQLTTPLIFTKKYLGCRMDTSCDLRWYKARKICKSGSRSWKFNYDHSLKKDLDRLTDCTPEEQSTKNTALYW